MLRDQKMLPEIPNRPLLHREYFGHSDFNILSEFSEGIFGFPNLPSNIHIDTFLKFADFEIYASTIMVWNLLRHGTQFRKLPSLGVLWVDGRYRFRKVWFNHRGLEIDWLSKCASCVTHNPPFLTRTIVPFVYMPGHRIHGTRLLVHVSPTRLFTRLDIHLFQIGAWRFM